MWSTSSSASSQTALIQREPDLRLEILPEVHLLTFSFFNKLCGLIHNEWPLICVSFSFVLLRENASASFIWRQRKVHCQTREGFKSCWVSWDLCAFWCRLFCLMKVYAGFCTMVPSEAIHLGAVHITLTISGDVTCFLYFLRLVTRV